LRTPGYRGRKSLRRDGLRHELTIGRDKGDKKITPRLSGLKTEGKGQTSVWKNNVVGGLGRGKLETGTTKVNKEEGITGGRLS